MPNSWRTWCRLCANRHSTIGVFMKTEESYNIAEIAQKFLRISIDPADVAPPTICESCYKFLVSIVEFSERVIKVEAMYASIVNSEADPVDDCASWRIQFGLLDGELPPYYNGKIEAASDDGFNSNIELLQMDYKIEEDADIEDKVECKFNSPPNVEKFTKDVEDTIDSNFEQHIDNNHESNLETNEPKGVIAEDPNITPANKNQEKKARTKREPPFKCSKCDMVYLSYNQLRYHTSSIHYNKQVSCRYCNKKFPSKTIAEQHEIVHLDPDKKPAFPCSQCNRSYTKASNLSMHIRANHSGERAFICDICGKSFATKGGLKEHKIIHNEERPFQCPLCPKMFKALEGMKVCWRHKDSHGEKKYPCPECGLVLNTKQTLRTHKVVHSDERKFRCTVCGSEFKRSKTLKTHMVTHTRLRPHTCPHCDKAFAEVWEFRGHVKKAHPLEVYPAEVETE